MAAVNSVLIVGAGTAGCALATLLARHGVAVDVVEIREDWNVRGSGITLMGNALRVLRELGVWPELEAAGYPFSGSRFFTTEGPQLAAFTQPSFGGDDLPAILGLTRPQLAETLSRAATQAGAKIYLQVVVDELDDEGSHVRVAFSNGTEATYDLVVGADGARSQIRHMIGIDTTPEPTGLGIWRAHAGRPASVDGIVNYQDGPCYSAGCTPTGAETLYAYLIEDFRPRTSLTREEQLQTMRDLGSAYAGPWSEIPWDLVSPHDINYTALESMLVEGPWHRGRVVLVGDALHVCPPVLAQGAAMSLEDAYVLAEVLLQSDDVDDALLDSYAERRIERVRTVVEGSMQILRLFSARSGADIPAIMHKIRPILSQPC